MFQAPEVWKHNSLTLCSNGQDELPSRKRLLLSTATLEATAERVEVAEGLVLLRNKHVTEAAGNTNSVCDQKPACDQRTTEKAMIQESKEEVDKSEFSSTTQKRAHSNSN